MSSYGDVRRRELIASGQSKMECANCGHGIDEGFVLLGFILATCTECCSENVLCLSCHMPAQTLQGVLHCPSCKTYEKR